MASFVPSFLPAVFYHSRYGDSYLVIKLPCKSIISNEILQELLVNRLSISFQIGNVMHACDLLQLERVIVTFAHTRTQS